MRKNSKQLNNNKMNYNVKPKNNNKLRISGLMKLVYLKSVRELKQMFSNKNIGKNKEDMLSLEFNSIKVDNIKLHDLIEIK